MQGGFTLIEIMISLSILVMLFGLGLYMTMDTFRLHLSRSERDMVVGELQLARSRALANIKETNWGVCYDGTNYVVFRGSYLAGAATNESMKATPSAAVSSTGNAFSCTSAGGGGIIFTQLSGAANATTITILQNGQSKQISTNNEGTIIW
jgi:prepilin-type N-terminal cleavage/methylation domain-containing protein